MSISKGVLSTMRQSTPLICTRRVARTDDYDAGTKSPTAVLTRSTFVVPINRDSVRFLVLAHTVASAKHLRAPNLRKVSFGESDLCGHRQLPTSVKYQAATRLSLSNKRHYTILPHQISTKAAQCPHCIGSRFDIKMAIVQANKILVFSFY